MNRFTRNKKFIVATMILLAVFYILPGGIHLSLCFGEDGHFDISAEVCNSHHKSSIEIDSRYTAEEHHGNCRDIQLSCDNKVSFSLSSSRVSPRPRVIDHQITYIFNPADNITHTSLRECSSDRFISERCNYHPPFLNSVILLI